MTYQGHKNWDTWETLNVLTNTEAAAAWLAAWQRNFLAKLKRGKFDHTKAEYAVAKYIIPVACGRRKPPFPLDGFIADPDIDPDKVDKAEIVEYILNNE